MAPLLLLMLAGLLAPQTQAQVCSRLNSFVQIPETDPNATDIASDPRYRAVLATNVSGDVRLSLMPSGASPHLSIGRDVSLESNASSGEVYLQLLQPVDRDGELPGSEDDLTNVTFQIRCVENSFNYFHQVTLEILDINDNYPQFENESYAFTMNELTAVSLTAFQGLRATDLDGGQNGEVDLEIVPGDGSVTDGSSLFSIPDPSSGIIVVEGDLDFDSLYRMNETSYWLNISATDRAANESDRKANYTLVEVMVVDLDDLGPEFVYPTCFLFQSVCLNPEYRSFLVSGAVNATLEMYPIPAEENGTAVTILARDQDTFNYSVSFSIETTVPSGYEDYFNVSTFGPNNDSLYEAQVYQVASIRRSRVPSLRLVLKATENSTNAHYSRAIIHFTTGRGYGVSYRPRLELPSGNDTGFIFEKALLDTYVMDQDLRDNFRIAVTDPEVLWFDPAPRYTFETVPNDTFRVDSQGHVRLVRQPLHSEEDPMINFTVIVTDEDSPQKRSASISLTVSVLDLNDNEPAFDRYHYDTRVAGGDYSPGKKGLKNLIRVHATDADEGDNAKIDYGVASVVPPSPGLFYVTANGWVGVAGVVHTGERYVVEIRARDRGSPSLVDSVLLDVLVTEGNVGPEIPFDDVTIYVSEGVLLNSTIWKVPATDHEGDVIIYNMTSGNTGNTFSLDRRDGTITNVIHLDRETEPQYNLTISTRDHSDEGDVVTLHIIVTDVNDNSPTFSGGGSHVFRLQEGLQPPLSVGTLVASDADEPDSPNSQIRYRLSQDFGNYFHIDANTGAITTRRSLDHEAQGQHLLVVEAIDSGAAPRTGTALVTVSVTDVDDQVPLFHTTAYSASLAAGAAIGTTVLTVSAADRDATPNVVYELAGADASAFTIDGQTGVVRTRTRLDSDAKSRYVFQVTTAGGRSSSQLAATATVTVTALRASSTQEQNNFAPAISGPSSRTVQKAENVQIGEVILRLTATDGDTSSSASGTVRYRITSVTPGSARSLFYLHPESGELVLSGQLSSVRSHDTFLIEAVAEDLGNPPRTSSPVTVSVGVARNTAPRFLPGATPTSTTLRQDVPAGTTVLQASALDSDSSQALSSLTYALTGDGNAQDYFQADGSSGSVSVRRPLSTDTALTYTLRIVATDGGGLSATATATVSVMRNLNRPELLQQNYTQTVPENHALNTPLVTLRARDRDLQSPHNQIQFSVVGDQLAQQYLSVNDDGELFLFRSPAGDPSISRFNVEVAVRDRGEPSPLEADRRAHVEVRLTRNNHAPSFRQPQQEATVREDASPGAVVIQVSATDLDTQASGLTYRLVGDGPALTYFRIASSSGQVSLSRPLADTSQDRFTLRVEADDGSRTGATLVYVTVRRNFHAPTFPVASLSASLLETQPLLEPFLTVSASDSDRTAPSNTVYYELVGNQSAQTYFHLTPAGALSVRKPLTSDPAQTNTYTLTVRALDRGTPQLSSPDVVSVVITVERNRFSPVFTGTPYSLTLTSSLGFDPVFQVSASDDDSRGNFSVVRYYIEGEDANLWRVNPVTGEISALSPGVINTATVEVYYITVRATDGVTSAVTVVTLTVSRNQFAPVFSPVHYSVTILETQPLGAAFFSVTATDLDVVSPNMLITYQLASPSSLFSVSTSDTMTAEVSVKGDLPADRGNIQYKLAIIAWDRGKVPRQSPETATVTINVHRNYFTPRFLNTPFQTSLPRSAAPGILAFNVTASDNDAHRPFNVIHFRLLGDEVSLRFFRLNASSGQIFLSQSLTTAPKELWLTVEARDGGVPSMASVAVVHFSVVDSTETDAGSQGGCVRYVERPSSRTAMCTSLLIPLIVVSVLLFLTLLILLAICCSRKKKPRETVYLSSPMPPYSNGKSNVVSNPTYHTDFD